MSVWAPVAMLSGAVILAITLQDAFEVVLLPRLVSRRLRLMRIYFSATWRVWLKIGLRFPAGPRREGILAIYGPGSMVILFTFWIILIILGFGLFQWGLKFVVTGDLPGIGSLAEMSGDAFFTLGLDSSTTPVCGLAYALVLVEAGIGFGFIALAISYLPVLQHSFTQRDVQLIHLSARAASPPTSLGVLIWYVEEGHLRQLVGWLGQWEAWCAELIESHSMYPMLAFYRSQHDSHSWLASLAVVLDSCSLLIAGSDELSFHQAESTFSVARRVLSEICTALALRRADTSNERHISPQDLQAVQSALELFGCSWSNTPDTLRVFTTLAGTYEPLLSELSCYLKLPLPRYVPEGGVSDIAMPDRKSTVERLTGGCGPGRREATQARGSKPIVKSALPVEP